MYVFEIVTLNCQEKKPNGKSRPVIVKFVRYNTRNLIFKSKKKLEVSRINITENFTAKKMKKLQTAGERNGFKNVLDARWKDYVLGCSE